MKGQGRHIHEVRQRARRPDPKSRKSRGNRKRRAVEQSKREG